MVTISTVGRYATIRAVAQGGRTRCICTNSEGFGIHEEEEFWVMEGDRKRFGCAGYLNDRVFVFAVIACDTRQGNEASMGVVDFVPFFSRACSKPGLFHD